MRRRDSVLSACLYAWFLDLPFLVDSFWRKFEYEANRNHTYRIRNSAGAIAPRPVYRSAHFFWLALVLVFIAYGPTHAPLCGIAGEVLSRILRYALALLAAVAGAIFVVRFGKTLRKRARRRLHRVNAPRPRHWALYAVLMLFLTGGAFAFGGAAYALLSSAHDVALCAGAATSVRSFALLAGTTIALICAALLAKRAGSAQFWQRYLPLLILAFAAIVWVAIPDPTGREADGIPYRHSYTLAAFVLFALALLGRWVAHGLLRSPVERLKNDFNVALRHTELFAHRYEPDLAAHRVWHALVNGAIYQPLLLFFLPSLVALVLPDRFLYGGWIAALVFSALLLAWGSISKRWGQMVSYVQRWFLTGTPLAVSALVIVLAFARLAGNHYVATILAAAPFGAIFIWIAMTYSLLWLFEHVINQALGVRLLSMFTDQAASGIANYPMEGPKDSEVAQQDRYLTTHGAGRFAVVGRLERSSDRQRVAFHTYGYSEFFATLAANGPLIERQLARPGLAYRLTEGANEIERRTKLYYNILNLSLVAFGVGLFCYAQYHDRHYSTQAVVTADRVPADTSAAFDLRETLIARAQADQPSVIVAASGGGTRAALYTASALEGLARIGAADDIVLVSGVSGGGVALADFAIHRADLPQGERFAPAPWEAFKERLTEPFIEDVIDGAMEWRLVGPAPLSSLLVESFERRLVDFRERNIKGDARFAAIEGLGLLLNTSIAGHPADDSDVLSSVVQLEAAGAANCTPYTYLTGSRLAFTNLRDADAFPAFRNSRLPDVDLPYVVVRDPDVSIAAAAALNANFPPVFPNARVDIVASDDPRCGSRRSYYVTDGGATENLGLISALHALHEALNDWPEGTPPPKLHVVALEASASDYDYRQDRGVGTATGGAKERLAGGLAEGLLDALAVQLKALTQDTGAAASLDLHYLAMPLPLRSRGGIGTHWMLANDILVTNPHRIAPVGWMARALAIGPDARDRVRITRCELFALLNAMHSQPGALCATQKPFTANAQKVADWICGPRAGEESEAGDLHVREWRRLVAMLGNPALQTNARVQTCSDPNAPVACASSQPWGQCLD